MDAVELARRMQRERLFWVEVAPGKRIQVLRPLMDELTQWNGAVGVEHACGYLRNWQGIVVADLLKGSEDQTEVEFEAGLAKQVVRDNMEWSVKLAQGISEAVSARAKETAAAEKNSEPS